LQHIISLISMSFQSSCFLYKLLHI